MGLEGGGEWGEGSGVKGEGKWGFGTPLSTPSILADRGLLVKMLITLEPQHII